MRGLAAATVLGVAMMASGAAWADTSLVAPGVYFGNTTENDHYTVSNNPDVEIGLTAVQRFIGNYTPNGTTYDVATGTTTAPFHTGTDWGVSFSIHLLNGLSINPNSNISAIFSLTDTNLSTTNSINVLTFIGDNAEYDGTTTCADISKSGTLGCSIDPNHIIGVQNSESLSFTDIINALDPGFDINANDTYLVSLEVLDGRTTLGTDSITINAGTGSSVPEPITLSLFGAGLAGAVAMKRRRKAKA